MRQKWEIIRCFKRLWNLANDMNDMFWAADTRLSRQKCTTAWPRSARNSGAARYSCKYSVLREDLEVAKGRSSANTYQGASGKLRVPRISTIIKMPWPIRSLSGRSCWKAETTSRLAARCSPHASWSCLQDLKDSLESI
ncbi:hypothetical protein KVR01_001624 [Diaporthe batatas]|uniref:uncharacterized protein n=1 Tax=Diaporthe batatas TaxID=748121 RepID=UPI001D03EDA1|nr:uncharacterized protein KVR01_001624 [Diaporthe batatas]KAG8168875.1 hypothetical protein KVR01_001624 [Diaporthe batatas]